MMAEQSEAFLTERDHALLRDIFYELIGNSEDPAEVQDIESLMRVYEGSGDGSEIADADVRHTLCLVCKYCRGISDRESANNDLLDFYANSLKKLQIQYEQTIREHRRLEEDQIKLYQDYDNLMKEHLRLFKQYEKKQSRKTRWLHWLIKL